MKSTMSKYKSKMAKDMPKTNVLNKIVLFYALIFTIPLLLDHTSINVWFTGIAVNCVLFVSCFYLSKKALLPLVIFPSIAMAMKGLLVEFLVFEVFSFIPFIWFGNLALVMLFKALAVEKKFNKKISVLIAAFSKALLIGGFAYIFYVKLNLTSSFLIAMSLMQIVTALIGGFLALGIYHYQSK